MKRGRMNAEVFRTIAVGDVTSYTLSPSQHPARLPRTYRGVVNRIHGGARMVSVWLLDEELEALNEPVSIDHIQSVAKPDRRELHRQRGQITGGPYA